MTEDRWPTIAMEMRRQKLLMEEHYDAFTVAKGHFVRLRDQFLSEVRAVAVPDDEPSAVAQIHAILGEKRR